MSLDVCLLKCPLGLNKAVELNQTKNVRLSFWHCVSLLDKSDVAFMFAFTEHVAVANIT